MRLSKTGKARVWAVGLAAMTMIATVLVLVVNPLQVAAVYLLLLGMIVLAGLLTNVWGGLAASAVGVFAIVLFNAYAGIYLRESRVLNIGTELGMLLLVGPLAGGLGGALNQLQREGEHWLAQAEALTAHEATFDTLKPDWALARLEEEALRAARFQRPLSVALLQLIPRPEAPAADRAQRVGALQAVIRAARAAVPPPAVIAHAGGDQVLLILPEHTAEQARELIAGVLARLAQAVYFPATSAEFNQALGKPLHEWGTLRAGAAAFAGEPETAAALLARAKAELES